MLNNTHKIVIGTRGSSLALKQTEMVIAALAIALPDLQLETRIIKTTGDIQCNVPLKEIGGKEVFTREIDAAMLRGEIDIAVHSLKDVAGDMTSAIELAAVLPREDARDSLIGAASLNDLPHGAKFATSSPRRTAKVLKLRPDLQMQEIRGNVQTRIDKIAAGEAAASILASAGLIRLGLNQYLNPLPLDEFIPAAGQAIIGITCLKTNSKAKEILQHINHEQSFFAAQIEREIIRNFGGDCHSPIAAHAEILADKVLLRSFIASEDCKNCESFVDEISHAEALKFATAQGKKLRSLFDDFAN